MLTLIKFQESIPSFFFSLAACLSCYVVKKSIFKISLQKYSFYNKIKTFKSKNTHSWLFLLYLSYLEQFLFCLTKDFTLLLANLSYLSSLTLPKRAYSSRLKSSKHAKMSAHVKSSKHIFFKSRPPWQSSHQQLNKWRAT
jgi:hypothetical protein